jgi:Secretion system C-terminal sorting domain
VGWYLNEVAITNLTPAIPNTASVSFQSTAPLSNTASLVNPTQITTALPIELLSFTGTPLPQYNLLEWTTASEQNVRLFIVERSSGNGQWTAVGTHEPAGNAATTRHYRLEDPAPLPTAYYRLRSLDFDGSEYVSPAIIIERLDAGIELVEIFPNPVSGRLTLQLVTNKAPEVLFLLENVLGATLKQGSFSTREGFNQWEIEMSDLPGGVYWLRLNAGGKEVVRKVLKN